MKFKSTFKILSFFGVGFLIDYLSNLWFCTTSFGYDWEKKHEKSVDYSLLKWLERIFIPSRLSLTARFYSQGKCGFFQYLIRKWKENRLLKTIPWSSSCWSDVFSGFLSVTFGYRIFFLLEEQTFNIGGLKDKGMISFANPLSCN